jgi:hypothetical protein
MSKSDELRGLLLITFAGGAICYRGWKNIKRINRVKDSARQLISAASAGQVELEAIAWPMDKTDKCLEAKTCVYLELILEEYKGSRKNKSWQEIWRYNSKKAFLAFDQSGFVSIHPFSDHFIDVRGEKIYQPHRMSDYQQKAFGSLYGGGNIFRGGSLLGFALGSNFRIKEKKIVLGSPLLIHGFFRPEDKIRFLNLEPKLADFRSRCNKLIQSESFKKRFFDKNKDGSITRDELSEGFERVLNLCQGDMSNTFQLSPAGEPHSRFYGVVSANENEPLHIADTFEEQFLESKSTFMAWMSFSFGMLVFLLGLYLTGQYLSHR